MGTFLRHSVLELQGEVGNFKAFSDGLSSHEFCTTSLTLSFRYLKWLPEVLSRDVLLTRN